ncbi:hypothetical protein EDC01DRAFT_677009 [Geopyxis carbonaria]|nr:hypothetical protein EDC01DRAFT_677009 [Geopyxis carbonaria]
MAPRAKIMGYCFSRSHRKRSVIWQNWFLFFFALSATSDSELKKLRVANYDHLTTTPPHRSDGPAHPLRIQMWMLNYA